MTSERWKRRDFLSLIFISKSFTFKTAKRSVGTEERTVYQGSSRHFGRALPCVSVNNINEPKTHALFSNYGNQSETSICFHLSFFTSLTQVHEETGILLTKPIDLIPRLEEMKEDVKEINEADIQEAANIPKERAKLRKAQLQAQAVVKEKPLSHVDGTGVTCEANQGTTWKVSGVAKGMVTEVTTSLSSDWLTSEKELQPIDCEWLPFFPLSHRQHVKK